MGHRARSRVPRSLALLAASLFASSLASSLLTAGCVQEVPLETYELSGRVTVLLDAEDDGAGIASARVTFVSDTLIVQETTADGEGRYRMRVSTDHPFGQVRAEAEGFLPREETVFFDTDQRRVDIALRRQAD